MRDNLRPLEPGEKFGRLTVVGSTSEIGLPRSINGKRSWVCSCECGGSTIATTGNLRGGKHLSCGCLSRERTGDRSRTHGMSRDPLYAIWQTMIARCERTTDPGYPNYGGRGVKVCPEWRNSFEVFLADVGPRPSKAHSLDRWPDRNGDYEPGNVRWATATEQGRNTRRNRLVQYQGRTMPLAEACELSGLPYGRVKNRIRDGWPEDRLFVPDNQRRSRKDAHWIEIEGERMCLTEAAERAGLTFACVDQRIRRGWPRERWFEPLS